MSCLYFQLMILNIFSGGMASLHQKCYKSFIVFRDWICLTNPTQKSKAARIEEVALLSCVLKYSSWKTSVLSVSRRI